MLRVDAVADRRLYAILAQQYSGRRSGFSQYRIHRRRYLAGVETRVLLPENAVRHLKLANCSPKIPPSISKSPTSSPKCCTASQGRRLLPGDAAPELKVASCFPKMPPSI